MKPKHRISVFGIKYSLPDLHGYVFNYDTPIASRIIDGIDYRITQGFIDLIAKKSSVILYKDGYIIGVFDVVDEAKDFVEENHKKFCDIKNNLYLYNLNPYNQN